MIDSSHDRRPRAAVFCFPEFTALAPDRRRRVVGNPALRALAYRQTRGSRRPWGSIFSSPGTAEDGHSPNTVPRRIQAPWKTAGVVSAGPGRLFLELACWGVGLLLIAVYFGATIGFENERREGIEVFARAQAAAESTSEAELVVLPQDVDRAEPPRELDAKLDSLPVAVLRMPGLGLEVPVFSDISERNLSRGAGSIPGTALPNDGGNMAIAVATGETTARRCKMCKIPKVLRAKCEDCETHQSSRSRTNESDNSGLRGNMSC